MYIMIVGDKRDTLEAINQVLVYAATNDASPPLPILCASNVSGGGNSNGSFIEHNLNTTAGSSSPESSGSQGGVLLGEKEVQVEDEGEIVGGLDGPNGNGSGDNLRAALGLVVGAPVQGEPGNKCGKCQNHEIEISKKGHARDCPFKKCNCLKCRLLDARSDILQVISGKETKLKGTKKDPNCGFCQNHNIKILRKGHVRSCGFGQERHFRLDNCFDCEVHYIRNEVNRLQIKMRRAMKEDRTLTEEQRKTAREAITRDEVEKVCNLARLARKKRENILTQQAGSGQEQQQLLLQHSSNSLLAAPSGGQLPVAQQSKQQQASTSAYHHHHHHHHHNQLSADLHKHNYHNQDHLLNSQQHGFGQPPLARQVTGGDVWRPWSQHHQRQVALAQHHQQHHHHQVINLVSSQASVEPQAVVLDPNASDLHLRRQQHPQILGNGTGNSYQHESELIHLRDTEELGEEEEEEEEVDRDVDSTNFSRSSSSNNDNIDVVQQLSPPSTPPTTHIRHSTAPNLISATSFANSLVLPNAATLNLATDCDHQQHIQAANNGSLAVSQQRNLQEQQLFNTLFRLIVAQFAQSTAANVGGH